MITEEEENIVLLWLHSRKRKRMWVHDLNVVRPQRGEYSNLCRELYSYEDRFYIYFRMSPALFEELHSLICHKINKKDTNWRKAITTKERLAVSLRYLGTGDSFQMIALSHRIGRSTLHNIIKEVCKAIWEILQPIYIPKPTQRTWIIAETGYRQKWKFPNCIGSIDGKHVTIKCPQRSGSLFYCYKSKFSIVLLAVVDPDYKFTYVNVGSYGKDSDSKVFEDSEFFRKLVNNELHIPPPKPLPGGTTNLPHVFIGDEGFALQTYLMRPFPRNQAENNGEKANFNKRLSSARRIVENAFGILAHKWRVFFRPLETKVDTTVHIVKAACCLHNYLRVKNELFEMQTPEETMPRNSAFRTINNNTHRARNEAYNVRNCFMNYFND